MKKGSSSLLLLDVNVLFALAWPNHQFHRAATRRLESGADRWATCALTQLGFIRLSSSAAAVSTPRSPAHAAHLLAEMVKDSLHVYLERLPAPVAPGPLQLFEKILGSKQVTDVYLLGLAKRFGATLLTFDIRMRTLREAERQLEVLTG